jgi:amino acid adenylation domain-containing protein
MKNIQEFLSDLCNLDIKIWVEDGRLRCSAPKNALTLTIKTELAERKAEILAFINKTSILDYTQVSIQPVPRQGNLPLSFAQQRLWFIDQFEVGSSLYNLPTALRLKGTLNIDALSQTLNEILHRHEILRTSFVSVEGQPIQVITPSLSVTLPIVSLEELPEVEREAEVQRRITNEAQQPFNLTEVPLLRATLLRLSQVEHILIFTMHHIVSDGWSMGILIKEVTILYQAFCNQQASPLAKLPIQYADFAVWQREWLAGERLNTQLAYWRQHLGGNLPVLQLPTNRPRSKFTTFHGATYSFCLSSHLSEALKVLSNNQGVTVFMTLLAGFKTLLYRYTAIDDILVGSPIANRNRAELEGLIGCFVNTLVLRTDMAGNPSFRELLGRVRECTLSAYAHQDLPFEYLVEKLQPERDFSRNPIFQVSFGFHDDRINHELELPGLTISFLKPESKTAKFDLSLDMHETASGLTGELEYNTDLFDASIIQQMVGNFCTLLEAIVANPQQRILELPLLTEPEKQQLLGEWNNTEISYPRNQCIHELFESQVERNRDAIAVFFQDEYLTYHQLNTKANQLAHYLQNLGVKSEVLVGICVERSLEMLVGLLGILKAGGAYLPLDPAFPPERLASMLEDAQVSVLLTQQHLQEMLPAHVGALVCLDSDWQTIAQESQDNLLSGAATDQLAYVIYTSGSTGKPKGVQIQHAGVVNFLNSMHQQLKLTDTDTLLAVTTITFDIAVLELFLPITIGGRVVIVSREVASDGEQLLEILKKSQATVMQATPTTWRMLLAAKWQASNQFKILCGGEALPRQLANQLLAQGVSVWNLYGPTETTIWSCIFPVDSKNESVPIGRPLANTQVYILDPYLKPLPVGVIGELYIGGAGLSRGYLNLSELTAEKFISNPFEKAKSRKLYKTGDLARYLPDGNIEFLGRIDHQVKIRGFRIELGEIEALLSQHPDVQEAVVVAKDNPGNQHLVAYIVSLSGNKQSLFARLREFLKQKLPIYMLPAVFVLLEALPLTANGKIDRRALPVTTNSIDISTFVPPRTPVEEVIANIWTEILNQQQVSIHDNFFELGGHSLLGTQVISRLCEAFQVELPLRSLFESPTVASMAEYINAFSIKGLEIPPLLPASRDKNIPLSFAQQRLWFLDQLEPGNPAYNIPVAVRLVGSLDVEALKQSLEEIMKRHEALRTSFVSVDGQPITAIAPSVALCFPIIDLSKFSPPERETQARQLAQQEALQPFNLTQSPLIRVSLLRLDAEEHIILLTMHHIISDAWSMGVLVKEVTEIYSAFHQEKPSPLEALNIQYADFAIWQRQWLQKEVLQTQLNYWKQQLNDRFTPVALATPKRSNIPSQEGASQSFAFSQGLSTAIARMSRQEGVTLFMTLLAAFQTLLYCFTGTADIRVGSPIANRHRLEVEPLIGLFVNTLILRIDLSGNPSFRELLVRSRQVTLEAHAHQDLPFEKLVEELQPERKLHHNSLYQAWFVLQNTPIALELPGLVLTPFEVESQTARHDLLLAIWESPEGLNGKFEYKTELFDKAIISRLIGQFETLVCHVLSQPDATLDRIAAMLAQTDTEQQRMQKAVELQKLKITKRKTIRN